MARTLRRSELLGLGPTSQGPKARSVPKLTSHHTTYRQIDTAPLKSQAGRTELLNSSLLGTLSILFHHSPSISLNLLAALTLLSHVTSTGYFWFSYPYEGVADIAFWNFGAGHLRAISDGGSVVDFDVVPDREFGAIVIVRENGVQVHGAGGPLPWRGE